MPIPIVRKVLRHNYYQSHIVVRSKYKMFTSYGRTLFVQPLS